MPAYIENPRRTPRAQVRCEGRVALRDGGYWASPTRDYGPRGCQLEAPAPLVPGGRIFVELVNERTGPPVALAGRVAWCAKQAPWRVGIAFDAGSAHAAERFFRKLTAAHPGVDASGNAPERVPAGAPLAPASPPPDARPVLTPEEVRVLRTLGAGRTAGALIEALGADEASLTALFSLLGRRYVAIGGPDAGAAERWASVLAALP